MMSSGLAENSVECLHLKCYDVLVCKYKYLVSKVLKLFQAVGHVSNIDCHFVNAAMLPTVERNAGFLF